MLRMMSVRARSRAWNWKNTGRFAVSGYFIGLHIRFTSPLLTFQTYDQRWIDHYTENGYVLRDPMTAWGFSRTGWIRWSDPALLDPFGLFKEAAQFGLNHGVTVACGPIKSRTIAVLPGLTGSFRTTRSCGSIGVSACTM